MPHEGRTARLVFRFGVGIEVALAALVSAVVLTKPKFVLDGRYVIDDAYYTMTIARSLAHGNGPSASYGTVTSGFQPLQAFFLAPFNWVFNDPWTMLRVNLALCFFYGLLLIVVVANLARRIAGVAAGLIAGGIVALSPTILRISAAGLETSLSMLCSMSLVSVWIWARTCDQERKWPWIATGIVAGMTVLARIDTVPLILAVFGLQLVLGRRRVFGPLLAAMAITLAPWWTYAIITFGTPIPQSGMHLVASRNHAAGLKLSTSIVGANTLFGPFSTATRLQGLLMSKTSNTWTAYVFVAIMMIVSVASWLLFWRGRKTEVSPPSETRPSPSIIDRSSILALVPLSLWAIFLSAFYAWFQVNYYTYRYVAPVAPIVALIVGCVVGVLYNRFVTISHRVRRFQWIPACAIAVALLFILAPQAIWFATTRRPVAYGPQGTSHGAFIESATGNALRMYALFPSVPKGSVIAADQTGTLGWFGSLKDYRVVNLDGVVNPNITSFSDMKAVCREINRRRVEYLYDFQLMIINIIFNCGQSIPPFSQLFPYDPNHKMGSNLLYQIHWDQADGS